MIDTLSALSLYRQLEALDKSLTAVKDDTVSQFLAAFKNQDAFNQILALVKDKCSDAPEYLQTFAHIEQVTIPKGADRSAYLKFLSSVQMLKSAVGALLEFAATPDEKKRIGF